MTHGPLIHANAVLKVAAHVDDAVAKGAKVLVGGKKREGKGHFYEVSSSRSRLSLFLLQFWERRLRLILLDSLLYSLMLNAVLSTKTRRLVLWLLCTHSKRRKK